MKYLTAACPAISRVVLVESGSRAIVETAIPRLRAAFGPEVRFQVVTCFAGAPSALDGSSSIFRTQQFNDSPSRANLVKTLQSGGATVIAIVCSGESVMNRWKWWLAWKLPTKVLVINENADFFWFDSSNVQNLRRLAAVRLGVSGGLPGRAMVRLAMFPLMLIYLVAYAALAHTRRRWRLIVGPLVRKRRIE